jgi:hypothetical protein
MPASTACAARAQQAARTSAKVREARSAPPGGFYGLQALQRLDSPL